MTLIRHKLDTDGQGLLGVTANIKRGFFVLISVSDQGSGQVDHEISDATMAGMFIWEIFLSCADRFNKGLFSSEDLVEQGEKFAFHFFLELGDNRWPRWAYGPRRPMFGVLSRNPDPVSPLYGRRPLLESRSPRAAAKRS